MAGREANMLTAYLFDRKHGTKVETWTESLRGLSKDERGFSLTELVVAIAVALVLMGIGMPMIW